MSNLAQIEQSFRQLQMSFPETDETKAVRQEFLQSAQKCLRQYGILHLSYPLVQQCLIDQIRLLAESCHLDVVVEQFLDHTGSMLSAIVIWIPSRWQVVFNQTNQGFRSAEGDFWIHQGWVWRPVTS